MNAFRKQIWREIAQWSRRCPLLTYCNLIRYFDGWRLCLGDFQVLQKGYSCGISIQISWKVCSGYIYVFLTSMVSRDCIYVSFLLPPGTTWTMATWPPLFGMWICCREPRGRRRVVGPRPPAAILKSNRPPKLSWRTRHYPVYFTCKLTKLPETSWSLYSNGHLWVVEKFSRMFKILLVLKCVRKFLLVEHVTT